MSYEIIVERKARRALARLPSTVYNRAMQAVNDLAEDPRPRQSRALDDDRQEVFVAEIWHRQRGYR